MDENSRLKKEIASIRSLERKIEKVASRDKDTLACLIKIYAHINVLIFPRTSLSSILFVIQFYELSS